MEKMEKPANISPISLSDIANMVRTEINAAASRQNADTAKRDAAAAKREAALEAKISDLREDMAKSEVEASKRETRQLQWIATLLAVAVVVLGVWTEPRDAPAVSPITVNNPPPIVYAAPPSADKLAE